MAATDRLIVTYTGKDERTNTPRPPAVPVGELLDTIDATARPGREAVLVQHPLQPFDPRNFTAPDPWSFDRVTLAGAIAMAGPRAERGPFLARPLPPVSAPVVELDDLVRFAQHPVRAFLRQRLGIVLGDFSDELEDALTVELEPLEQWGVGHRLLEGRLSGADMDACIDAEVARGLLPPGRLGAPVLDRLRPTVEAIAGHALRLGEGDPRSADVRIELGDGRILSGTVAGLHGDLLRTVVYSRVSPRHRIALWVRWLALAAADPGRPLEAVLVGRAPRGADGEVTIARFPPGSVDPRRELDVLLDLHARGLREPLPLGCLSSAAYVRGGAAAACREWESEWGFDKEDREPEHQLAFGRVLSFEDLVSVAPRPGEDWDPAETTRFGRLARRLWSGLLAAEELVQR
jgi:exodeoxyribonuclease V gamma subunit